MRSLMCASTFGDIEGPHLYCDECEVVSSSSKASYKHTRGIFPVFPFHTQGANFPSHSSDSTDAPLSEGSQRRLKNYSLQLYFRGPLTFQRTFPLTTRRGRSVQEEVGRLEMRGPQGNAAGWFLFLVVVLLLYSTRISAAVLEALDVHGRPQKQASPGWASFFAQPTPLEPPAEERKPGL